MRPRKILVVLLAVGGVALAGCAASLTDGAGTDTTTSRVTTDQSTTGRVADATVAYGDLAPEAQRVFRWTVRNGTVSDLGGLDSRAVKPLFENDYVRYDGTRYRVHAKRTLDPRLAVVNATTVPGNRTNRAVGYADLTGDGRATIRAIAAGNATDPAFDPADSPLAGNITTDGYAYVRYENQTYRLRIAHGHNWRYRFAVENTTEG